MSTYRLFRNGLIGLATACLIGTASAPASAEESCKMGFVDVQRAIDISRMGREAVKRVQEDFNRKRAQIDREKQELADLKQRLEKQNPNRTEKERQAELDTYNKRLRELKELIQESNRELEEAERAYTSQIISELSVLIQDYGRKHNYCFIFELKTSGIIYGDDNRDLTETIVNLYDEYQSGEQPVENAAQ